MVGEIFIVIANIFYAIGALFLKKLAVDTNPFLITAIVIMVSAIILLPIFLYFSKEAKTFSPQKWTWAILAGLSWFVVAELFYISGLSRATLSNVAILGLTFPLFATLVTVLFLGETITLKFIFAALLITAG